MIMIRCLLYLDLNTLQPVVDLGGVCFFYLMLNITFFELNAE